MNNYVKNEKRPIFGARFLEDPNNIYEHNVWDNIQWDAEQEEAARKKVEEQAKKKLPGTAIEQLQKETHTKWDKFYDSHQNRFFKDRHWLFTEFPELAGNQQIAEIPERVYSSVSTNQSASLKISKVNNESVVTQTVDDKSSNDSKLPRTGLEKYSDNCSIKPAIDNHQQQKNFFEIGCGVGNTVFPILEYNIDPNLFVYCCDFSQTAVDILKAHKDYKPKRCHAFVCDVTADDWKTPFPAASLDVTTLIFMLSAVNPQKMQHVVDKVYHYLKPGGLLLFRDYGRYDMAQLRFKDGQMMEDNFYARKDGTFVYFFTQDELREMFCQSGFVEELLYTDRRLQVNRSRQLKMYRVWVQAKFRKPIS